MAAVCIGSLSMFHSVDAMLLQIGGPLLFIFSMVSNKQFAPLSFTIALFNFSPLHILIDITFRFEQGCVCLFIYELNLLYE